MKNVERISGRPFWRVPIPGIRPTGWAVQYVSGMDGEEDIKEGYWLSQWNVSGERMSAIFNFEPELVMTFGDEGAAKQASDVLCGSDIKTRVVKIVVSDT